MKPVHKLGLIVAILVIAVTILLVTSDNSSFKTVGYTLLTIEGLLALILIVPSIYRAIGKATVASGERWKNLKKTVNPLMILVAGLMIFAIIRRLLWPKFSFMESFAQENWMVGMIVAGIILAAILISQQESEASKKIGKVLAWSLVIISLVTIGPIVGKRLGINDWLAERPRPATTQALAEGSRIRTSSAPTWTEDVIAPVGEWSNWHQLPSGVDGVYQVLNRGSVMFQLSDKTTFSVRPKEIVDWGDTDVPLSLKKTRYCVTSLDERPVIVRFTYQRKSGGMW